LRWGSIVGWCWGEACVLRLASYRWLVVSWCGGWWLAVSRCWGWWLAIPTIASRWLGGEPLGNTWETCLEIVELRLH